MKPDQERVRTLLTETITLLCKNGLHFKKQLRVQGLLGVTLDDDEVFIVHINETLEEKSVPACSSEESAQNNSDISASRERALQNSSPSRRLRKRRQFQNNRSAVSAEEVESEASLTLEDAPLSGSGLEISPSEATAEVGKHSSDSCHSYDTASSSIPVKLEPKDDDLIVVANASPPKRPRPNVNQNSQLESSDDIIRERDRTPTRISRNPEFRNREFSSISTKTELLDDEQEFDASGPFGMPRDTSAQPTYNVAMSENMWTENHCLGDPTGSVQRFNAANIPDVSWTSMSQQNRTDCFPNPATGDSEDSTSFPDGTATNRVQSMELWRYMRRPVDSAEKQYRCEYTGCGKSYYERKNLLQHQYLKHGRARVPRQW